VPFAPPTSDRAWHVEFDDDIVDFVEKAIPLQVRAVRAAP
jgi:hypothetical protein